MSEPTIRDVRDQLQYAIAQLRHAYQQLFRHDERWSRRGMQQFADGLIAPQIRKLEQVDRLLAALAAPLDPLPMVLHCPKCGSQHIDRSEPEKGWTNPPHRSHLCHACGTIWRPADVPTTGVVQVETQGSGDTWSSVAARDRFAHHGHSDSVLLSVRRDEVEAVTAFLTQRAAGGAEGQEQPRLDLWLCGCGAWNAVTLTNCGLCNRLRVKSGATRQYWQAAPVPQGAPNRQERHRRACECVEPDPVMQADRKFYCYRCSFETGARPRGLEPECRFPVPQGERAPEQEP